MAKYKVGDIASWGTQHYMIKKIRSDAYKLKLIWSIEPLDLIDGYHDWHSMELTDKHSRPLTKLEKAMK